MNLRHAAALAFVGWYLVTPHVFPNSREPNTTLPLSQWSRIGPMPSKSACEAKRSASMRNNDDPAMREKFKREILPELPGEAQREWPSQKVTDNYFDKKYFDDIDRYLKLSQCIASDDPRLKGK